MRAEMKTAALVSSRERRLAQREQARPPEMKALHAAKVS
jgi:hypothetical protein